MTNLFRLPAVSTLHFTVRLLALSGMFWAVGSQSCRAEVLTPGLIPDIAVVDQDGHAHRFFTDLVKGKIVAINFGYTSCTKVCPLQGQSFGRVQNLLGARLGQDIFLITVTTDPVNDTPASLKTWGAQFGAKPGWTLVTGNPADIQQLIGAFINPASVTLPAGAPKSRLDAVHIPVVVIINEPLKVFRAVFSLGGSVPISQALTTWSAATPVPNPPSPAKR